MAGKGRKEGGGGGGWSTLYSIDIRKETPPMGAEGKITPRGFHLGFDRVSFLRLFPRCLYIKCKKCMLTVPLKEYMGLYTYGQTVRLC
jgi:hypothetical protein